MASTLQAIIPFADPNHISTEPEQPVFGWQAGGLLVPRGHATILRAHRQSVGHSYAMCPVCSAVFPLKIIVAEMQSESAEFVLERESQCAP